MLWKRTFLSTMGTFGVLVLVFRSFRAEVNLLGGLQSSCILKLSFWECVFLERQLVCELSMLNLFAVSCVLKVYNQNPANNLFWHTPWSVYCVLVWFLITKTEKKVTLKTHFSIPGIPEMSLISVLPAAAGFMRRRKMATTCVMTPLRWGKGVENVYV